MQLPGLGGDGWIGGVDDPHPMPIQPRPQLGGRNRRDRDSVAEHEFETGIGYRRIDRQIRRPSLQHRQHRHDRLGRPGKQERHTLTRTCADGQSVTVPGDSADSSSSR